MRIIWEEGKTKEEDRIIVGKIYEQLTEITEPRALLNGVEHPLKLGPEIPFYFLFSFSEVSLYFLIHV